MHDDHLHAPHPPPRCALRSLHEASLTNVTCGDVRLSRRLCRGLRSSHGLRQRTFKRNDVNPSKYARERGSNARPLSHALSRTRSQRPHIRIASAVLYGTGERLRLEGVQKVLQPCSRGHCSAQVWAWALRHHRVGDALVWRPWTSAVCRGCLRTAFRSSWRCRRVFQRTVCLLGIVCRATLAFAERGTTLRDLRVDGSVAVVLMGPMVSLGIHTYLHSTCADAIMVINVLYHVCPGSIRWY